MNRMYNDEWKDNPEKAEELLSRELFELSLENRNYFQDEIHGVRCIAPEETPDLLRSSLDQMAYYLDCDCDNNEDNAHVIPLDQKRAYLQTKTFDNYKTTNYTHQDQFRLRFLRCELFDVPKAAIRMALFLDMLVNLFGTYALERPIRLSDFTREELCEFRKGRTQLLSDRDRGGVGTGRQIMCLFPGKEWAAISPKARQKITLYQFYMAGYDVDTQRKGVVGLVWFLENEEPSLKAIHDTKLAQLSVRISGVHLCSPDTPFYRMRRALAVMIIGQYRSRLRIHVGEAMKLRYILQGFGIPSDNIPITYSGVIKTATLRKWMRSRQLEENEHFRRSMTIDSSNSSKTNNNSNSNSNSNNKMIDSPYLTDILFRKGKSVTSHPGNATLRRLIKSKVESGACDNENYRTRKFIYEIINDMKHQHQQSNRKAAAAHRTNHNNPPVRLLQWDDEIGNCWREIDDENIIYNKIRRIVKEYQNIVGKGKSPSQRKNPITIIHQHGGTFIFQNQDGSRVPSTKKPRLNNKGGTAIVTATTTGVIIDEADSMECFGMNFMPY